MIIDTKELYDFVKKASMNGSINTMYIDITKDGLHCRVKNSNNVCMTDVKLNREIEDESMYGRVFIKNADMFMKILKTFGGDINVQKKGEYMIHISNSLREADIIMGSNMIVENIVDKELPVIPNTRTIEVDRAFLQGSLSDISLLKINELNIKTKDEFLYFIVGSEGESDVLLNKKEIEKGDNISVSIGSYLKELSESLDVRSTIEMSVGNQVPVVFKEVIGDFEFTCFIAPIITE